MQPHDPRQNAPESEFNACLTWGFALLGARPAHTPLTPLRGAKNSPFELRDKIHLTFKGTKPCR
jgi:hypothetical protein